MMRRRDLLGTLAVGWFADQALPDRPGIVGRIVGADHEAGHRVREAAAASVKAPAESVDVAIVGSGASAASAAWRLAAAGVEVRMLELEPFAGGTSSWGTDGAVPHPWGAHYLPVPERGARATTRLLEEMGVITGYDAALRPVFDGMVLCHAPEERIFEAGRWHAGLVPMEALSPSERREMQRFQQRIVELTGAIGSDGRSAFALPVEQSSRDPRFLALDELTMAEWLVREDFAGERVRWLANYGCLDDFGGAIDDVSAWAGLHYFAARKLETEQTEGSRYLVWPEGNGRLLQHLLGRAHGRVQHGALVVNIDEHKRGVRVVYLDVPSGELRALEARAAIVAAGAFVARRIVRTGELPVRASSPWVVANLHVHRPASPDRTWDNIIYDGVGLGYVDASHQRTTLEDRTVLTYFRAFGDADGAGTRRRLLQKSWAELASEALVDLAIAHPELPEQTERIDVMVWGHAMPRPRPGFLGPRPFEAPLWLAERVAWAHVDQTGLALFEEANLRGVRAAEAVCDALGVSAGESWV